MVNAGAIVITSLIKVNSSFLVSFRVLTVYKMCLVQMMSCFHFTCALSAGSSGVIRQSTDVLETVTLPNKRTVRLAV